MKNDSNVSDLNYRKEFHIGSKGKIIRGVHLGEKVRCFVFELLKLEVIIRYSGVEVTWSRVQSSGTIWAGERSGMKEKRGSCPL